MLIFSKKQKSRLLYNNNPPTFPDGLDVEVFYFLKEAHQAVDHDLEHVTPYIISNEILKNIITGK